MNKRTIYSLSLAILLVGSPVFAQGAGGSSKGKGGQALKDLLSKQGTAGPGSIQQSFMQNLQKNLQQQAGPKTGSKLFNNLQNSALSSKDATSLLNGNVTNSQMKNWFGASRKYTDDIEKSIDGAVEQKNKDGFFGMLNSTMTKDFGVDPSGDFAAQACGAKGGIDMASLKKLTSGNTSVKSISSIFGFQSKGDSKFMQKILNSLLGSGVGKHPMMKSLGMGGGSKKGGKSSGFDMSKFPKLSKGMPGFGMDEKTGGLAGGLPCDFELPPCPFFEGSFKDLLKKCGKKGDGSAEPDDEGDDKKKPAKKDKKDKKGKNGKGK